MQAKARARFVRVGPKKVRMLRDLIVGRDARVADQMLAQTTVRSAGTVRKVLRSALANADRLARDSAWTVANLVVDGGPTLKRFRAAPMGRGVRIRKRMSHITVILERVEGKGTN